MPPESMEGNPKYTSKLDVFSFGVLALYLMLQECPLPKDSSITVVHVIKKQIAIGKRAVYINQLKAMDRSIARVVENCWMDEEKVRPHSAQLSDHVEESLKPLKETLFTDTILFLQSCGKEIFVSSGLVVHVAIASLFIFCLTIEIIGINNIVSREFIHIIRINLAWCNCSFITCLTKLLGLKVLSVQNTLLALSY